MRMHTEWNASAIFVPYQGAEPTRCGISPTIIGDRAYAESVMARWAAEMPERQDWQLHERTYRVWDDLDEQLAFERTEQARLAASGLQVPSDVRWAVRASDPDTVYIELICAGCLVLVEPNQEAVDRACGNPAFRDMSTGSTGESWWDEVG